jgi:hypothetical protein
MRHEFKKGDILRWKKDHHYIVRVESVSKKGYLLGGNYIIFPISLKEQDEWELRYRNTQKDD